jgi:hypothetical protein
MELAHYTALLIEQHRDYLGDSYMKHLLYAGNMLQDATRNLVAVLDYFSEKGKVQILPLSMYVFDPGLLHCLLGILSGFLLIRDNFTQRWTRANAAHSHRNQPQALRIRYGIGISAPTAAEAFRAAIPLAPSVRSDRVYIHSD